MAKLYDMPSPESLISVKNGTPKTGRGAWTKLGIDFDYRYMVAPKGQTQIGTAVEKGLDYWAVAAGCRAIQLRLVELDHLQDVDDTEWGIFGRKTEAAVKMFQADAVDPFTEKRLVVDGTVGKTDARALFGPLAVEIEARHGIPDSLLVGQTNWESMFDPGAVGYYIFYPDYRGVDRSLSQINSLYHQDIEWLDAYDPVYALEYSASRLIETHDTLKAKNPAQSEQVLWDAAVCSHNNPSAGAKWAKTGTPPTADAAKYVASVKNARF